MQTVDMKIEHWAFVVSMLALLASIGIPIVQWKVTKKHTANASRTLLLQKILGVKSQTYIAMHELIWLLSKHGPKMENAQRSNLQPMVPRIRQQHNDLENLHEQWRNYQDGEPLEEIEKMHSIVDTMASEASDTAKLIENGKRSYEEA